MALQITHPYVSAIADSGDTSVVQPSDWNDDHTIAGLGTGVETALGVNVGTAGAVVVNGGALGTPSSGTLTNCTGLPVAGGGTGLASATAYAVICGGTTSTGAFQSIAAVGSSGQVLTSNGAGALPTFQAAGTNSGPTFPGGIPLTGMRYRKVAGSNLSTGDTDLYTVPAGKRLFIQACAVCNKSAGSIVWYPTIKISSTYYRLATNVTTNAGITGSLTSISYIAEAGEILAINTATNSGLNVWFLCVEYDDSCDVFSSKLTTLASGANTVYTVSANHAAMILSNSTFGFFPTAGLLYMNDSGGSRTVSWNIVDSGGSPATGNELVASVSVSAGVKALHGSSNFNMNAGDFVSINTDANTATQMAWVNVMEYPT